MLVIIIIAVIISILALLSWGVAAIIGLDYQTVFVACLIIIGAVHIVLFLNPRFIRAWREAKAEEKRKQDVLLKEFRRIDRKDRKSNRKYNKMLERQIDDYVTYGLWESDVWSGNYERYNPIKGTEVLTPEEYKKWRKRMGYID